MADSMLFRRIGEEAVLLPGTPGRPATYVILNETAASIWELRISGLSAQEIASRLCAEFIDASLPEVERDVDAVFAQFDLLASGTLPTGFAVEPPQEAEFRAKMASLQIPLETTIELTFRCNLRCLHCYSVHCRWDRPELTTEEVLDALDQMVGMGSLWVLFSGGEPLLRPDFETIYRHAYAEGLIPTVFSNGLLITDRVAQLFGQLPPHSLEISVYSASDKGYEHFAGAPKGFAQMTKALDRLDHAGVRYSLKSIMTRHNRDDLSKIKAIAEARGCRFRYDTELIDRLDGQPVPPNVQLGPEDAIKTSLASNLDEQLADWRRDPVKHDAFAGDSRLFYCQAGLTSFSIDPFGNVFLCGRVRQPSFSLRERTLASIWHGLVEFSSSPLVAGDFRCSGCVNLDYCKACPAAALMSRARREREYCQFAQLRREAITQLRAVAESRLDIHGTDPATG